MFLINRQVGDAEVIPNIEPRIFRKRLIIEGHYEETVDEETIRLYLEELSELIKMEIFAGPYSWPPDDRSHPEIELTELNGFVAWTDSGCHVYAWRSYRFFTSDIYSCKAFSVCRVVDFTKNFFLSNDLVYCDL